MLAIFFGDDAASIAAAAVIVKSGGLVAFPTDTVYGLGCDPWNERAVRRLFESKGRENKPVPVLCAGFAEAEAVVTLDPVARELASRFWPGALTIVAPLKRGAPSELDQRTGWLGVRVPNHNVARSLALGVGGWITGTSANLSGNPSCRTAQEVEESMGDRIDGVIDGGRTDGIESTVIKVVSGTVEVLRRGAIGVGSGITRESFKR
jgi:L-threonylcarbamoyladenylate synthase